MGARVWAWGQHWAGGKKSGLQSSAHPITKAEVFQPSLGPPRKLFAWYPCCLVPCGTLCRCFCSLGWSLKATIMGLFPSPAPQMCLFSRPGALPFHLLSWASSPTPGAPAVLTHPCSLSRSDPCPELQNPYPVCLLGLCTRGSQRGPA